MAKKGHLFRFDEKFMKSTNETAQEIGISTTELARNAISLYLTIYERNKEGKIRFYIRTEPDKEPIEVLLPWLT